MTDTSTPAVYRRRLRTELRAARQAAGLTQEQVKEAMDWSLSKIIRIEAADVTISTNDLRALLRLYHITDRRRIAELIELARSARKRSWLAPYRSSLPPKFYQYVEYEGGASIIRNYESALIPGLLQTDEYIRAVLEELRLKEKSRIIEDRFAVRKTRQELLEQSEPPLFFTVFDEAAISRLAGEPAARSGQIKRLVDMAQRSSVTIEIVPFSKGLYPGMFEPFSILEFPDPSDSDLLYVEGTAREATLSREEEGEIGEYRETFEDLRNSSLGPEGSLSYLQTIAGEFP